MDQAVVTVCGDDTIEHTASAAVVSGHRPGRRSGRAIALTPDERAYLQRIIQARIKLVGECWVWTRKVWRRYGVIRHRYQNLRAHRAAFAAWNGPIPAGLYVLHRCDNPSCVNPAHLFLGTQTDNMRDMAEKGRSMRGERHRDARLTEANVIDIRRRAAAGEGRKKMAREFGVTPATIRGAIYGRTWLHLKSEDNCG